MTDLTPEARIRGAEGVVREQRTENGGSEAVVRSGSDLPESIYDVVDADDYRDLRYELERLQRAVMGETEET